MQLIKSVEYFVSGSNKTFEIYECVVDEVEEGLDSKHRRTIHVTLQGKTFVGLFNKQVYEFLCANEGSPSFIVLWPSGKGNYMLAYKWGIWDDFANNTVVQLVPKDIPECRDAFVYMWVDTFTGMKYIGVHKGSDKDGYKGSGHLFLERLADRPEDFHRTILAYGTHESMIHLETILILQLKARTSGMYYNLSDNLRS